MDSKPQSFSFQDSKMQGDFFTNTYNQRFRRPNDNIDAVPWGNQGSTVQIGAKIILDNTNKQLYIVTSSNQKVYITKDVNGTPTPLPNAQMIVQSARNYGIGPCMQFMGTPDNPKIYMYTGNDMTPGNNFKPIEINSMADFQQAMIEGVAGEGVNHKYSGMYGQAAISPFQPLPKDVWSGVGVMNRAMDTIGEQLILPIAIEAVGSFVPGFSTFMSVTGIQDSIQGDIDGMFKKLHESRVYKSASTYDTSLSNTFKDPRLTAAFQGALHQNTQLGIKTKQSTPTNITRLEQNTPQQILRKTRALNQMNNSMSIDEQAVDLETAFNKLKGTLGNKVDWGYYDQMQSGLKLATDDQQKLNIISHFADKFASDVVPLIQAQATDTTPQPPAQDTAPPRASGFSFVPWHPYVINGNYQHPPGKVTIQG